MDRGSDLREMLEAFGAVLSYPGEGYDLAAARCAAAAGKVTPPTKPLMVRFAETVAAMPSTLREELFTRTFDLNPVCSLEVGWQLFGETYERGAFLVRCRGALRNHGIPESGELPDHLSHLLPLLARMDGNEAPGFAALVTRAVRKMAEGFGERDNPYAAVIDSLRLTLATAFGEPEEDRLAPGPPPSHLRPPSDLRGEIP